MECSNLVADMVNALEVNKVADMVADMEVDKVADMVADMEVDKVADMVVDEAGFLFWEKNCKFLFLLSNSI